jgi:hypothetical protein
MSTQFRPNPSRGLPPLFPVFPVETDPRKAFLVGITVEGALPLVEESRPSDGSVVLRLPWFEQSERADLNETAARALRDDFGYEPRHVFPMRSGVAAMSRPAFLLAPLLRPAVSSVRSKPGARVHEVFLPAVREYLSMRLREGAVIEPCVREGLLLAEEALPAWARLQLGAAIRALLAARCGSDRERFADGMPPKARAASTVRL